MLPPSHNQISIWEYIRNGFFLAPVVLGLRNYVRSMKSEQFVDDTRKMLMENRPYYYLWGLAVDPGLQQTGIGTILLKYVLQKANSAEVPVYLETHLDKNVPYYEKYGFELIHSAKIQKHDLPFWCMCREPKHRGVIDSTRANIRGNA